MTIRLIKYEQKYLPELLALFNHTIEHVNSADYSQAELNEWIQKEPDLKSWHETLQNSYCLLAMDKGTLVGFGTIAADGYLDFLYVVHFAIHQGVGRMLFTELEQYAEEAKVPKLYTYASITAVPFFEKMGLTVEYKQNNLRNGENLINYRMSKPLEQ